MLRADSCEVGGERFLVYSGFSVVGRPDLYLARSAGADVRVIQVQGPHLSRGYMNPEVGRQIGLFFSAHP